MYNTEVICTYNTTDIFLETDKINEKDKDFVRNAVYRQELLNILGVEEYNFVDIEKTIVELYNNIKECKSLEKCMKKLANEYFSSDSILGLMVLFSFDYMHLTHICISEYLKTGKVSETNMLNLEKNIFCN